MLSYHPLHLDVAEQPNPRYSWTSSYFLPPSGDVGRAPRAIPEQKRQPIVANVRQGTEVPRRLPVFLLPLQQQQQQIHCVEVFYVTQRKSRSDELCND